MPSQNVSFYTIGEPVFGEIQFVLTFIPKATIL